MIIDEFSWVPVLLFLAINAVSCVVHPDGESKVTAYQDDMGNYQFGYTVASNDGEHFHKQGTDGAGRVVGSYGLTEPDGRHRIVNYVADQHGFRANVRSNEPGVTSSKSSTFSVEKSGNTVADPSLHLAASDSARFGHRLALVSSQVSYAEPRESQEQSRGNEEVNNSDATRRRQPYRTERKQSIERVSSVPRVEYRPHDELPNIDSIHDRAEFLRNEPPSRPYTPPLTNVRPVQRPIARPQINRATRPFSLPGAPIFQPSTPPYGGFEAKHLQLPELGTGFQRFPKVPLHRVPSSSPSKEVTDSPGIFSASDAGGIHRIPYSKSHQSPVHRHPSYPNIAQIPQHESEASHYGRPMVIDSDENGLRGNPNIVLRAVAIPNGIRAVHVDASTGQIYRSSNLPVYQSEDFIRDEKYGSEGDKHISNYDRDNDSDPFSGYIRPLPLRSSLEDTVHYPLTEDMNSSYTDEYNSEYSLSDDVRLSKPSARDLSVISEIFEPLRKNSLSSQWGYPPSSIYSSRGAQRPNFESNFGTRPNLDGRFQHYPRALPPPSIAKPRQEEYQNPQFDEPRYEGNRRYRGVSEADGEASPEYI